MTFDSCSGISLLSQLAECLSVAKGSTQATLMNRITLPSCDRFYEDRVAQACYLVASGVDDDDAARYPVCSFVQSQAVDVPVKVGCPLDSGAQALKSLADGIDTD